MVEDRWAYCSARGIDKRIDALRRRANRVGVIAERNPSFAWAHQEHAALMWAIAELSGVADDVRRRQSEREEQKALKAGKLLKRAEHAERLYADSVMKNERLKVQNAALNDELYRLRREQAVAKDSASS